MVPQSEVEQRMVAEVTPHLLQGEQIMGMGSVRDLSTLVKPAWGQDKHRFMLAKVLVVVATNFRLLLLEGKDADDWGGMKVKFGAAPFFSASDRPREYPPAEVLEWWYQDLEAVQLQVEEVGLLGLGFKLLRIELRARHPALGAGKVCTFHACETVIGLPSHPHFTQQFMPSLVQQIGAGAFPLTPARQALIQQWEQAAQQHQHVAQQHQQAAKAQRVVATAHLREKSKHFYAKLGARSWGGLVGVLVPLVLGAWLALDGGIQAIGPLSAGRVNIFGIGKAMLGLVLLVVGIVVMVVGRRAYRDALELSQA